jgi:hypothetical protein
MSLRLIGSNPREKTAYLGSEEDTKVLSIKELIQTLSTHSSTPLERPLSD